MKNISGWILLIIIVLFSSCNTKIKTIEEGLNHCFSVFNMNDTLLVTNFGGQQFDPINQSHPTGYISQIINDSVSEFKLDSNCMYSPKGIFRIKNYLYVSDVCCVHVIDMTTPDHKIFTIPLSNADIYVYDLELVGDMLLLSSTSANKILAMQVDENGYPLEEIHTYVNVVGPTDMVYHDDKLFIASCNINGDPDKDNVIYIIDDFFKPIPKPLLNRQGQYSSLAVRNEFLYFSDWKDNIIGKFPLKGEKNVEFLDLKLDKSIPMITKIGFYDKFLYLLDPCNSLFIRVKI